jgi:hypothetical protein
MKIKKCYCRTIALVSATVLALGNVSGAFASDNSATLLPAEGNVVCADYAANSIILSMDSRSPDPSGTLTGDENPADGDTTGESVAYTISNGTSLSFSNSTTPIDYAVLKSGRDVTVAMYPSGGVTEDANLTVSVGGQDQDISAFSLCYGLGNIAPPPPAPQVTKSCDIDAVLDATGIQCPSDGSRALVCNLELDKPFFGTADGSDTCCVCNNAALTECDTTVPAGEPNACPDAVGSKTGTEVTTHIEINNDPYYCLTWGGRRTCYPY